MVGRGDRREEYHLNNSQVEALYQEARSLVRPGVQTAEDALHDAFVELLEGKIEPNQLLSRMRQRISAESRKARRHSAPRVQAEAAWGLDDNTRGPYAGEVGGFPYNSLKETTWS